MEQTAERQLRAYLSVTANEIQCQEVGPGLWQLRWEPVVTNRGQTPAYKVVAGAGSRILPCPLPADVDLTPPPPEQGMRSSSTMGAGQNTVLIRWLELTEAEFQGLIQATDRACYLFGVITYQDAFQVDRFTNFCFRAIFKDGRKYSYTETRHNEAS
jgi:hypothetical protein